MVPFHPPSGSCPSSLCLPFPGDFQARACPGIRTGMHEGNEGNGWGESGVNPFINIRLQSACTSKSKPEGKGRKKGEAIKGNR